MRVLITGCNGLLGQKLVLTAPEGWEVFGLDLHKKSPVLPKLFYKTVDMTVRVDLTQAVLDCQPDWILNAAGYTNVDGAETERDLCWRINVIAVENLAYAARKVKAGIVHVSTDYIFNGKNGPYDEDAVPDPLGFYGKSKLAGENALRVSPVDFAIARTMVIYGAARDVRPNFVTWLIEKLKRKEPVKIVTDQFGNTTLANELAQGIWTITSESALGILNVAGREIIDRFSFAKKIAKIFELNESLIHPIKTADFRQAAPRPMKSGLIVDKAIRELRIHLSDVEEGLVKFKEQYLD